MAGWARRAVRAAVPVAGERTAPGLLARLDGVPGLGALKRLTTRRPRARGAVRLDQPVDLRRPLIRGTHDPDSFGRASESIARFLGTGRFLVYMTAVVVVWIGWNVVVPARFDPFPFIFLTLVLSLQASYAAPLILLAQNRQDDRDRVNLDADRRTDAQTRADMDFLAREVASLRVAVGEVATRDYVRSEIRSLVENLTELLDERGDAAGEVRARKRAAGGSRGKGKGKGKDKARAHAAAPATHDAGQQGREDDGVRVGADGAELNGDDDEAGGTAT